MLHFRMVDINVDIKLTRTPIRDCGVLMGQSD